MARVVIEHLTRSFRGSKGSIVAAVRDLNVTIESGELLVLVGPSGSGKTTSLRLLAGLETPTEGAICIDGVDVTRVPARARDVAMVFQHHALHPHMTVFENLAFPLTIRKISRGEVDRRVKEMAGLLELADCLSRAPAQISGGQRQRVALGRALVRRPKLLLLDEPLSNLDGPLRAQMRRLIARVNATLGCTMVYVTHDQTEAMMLGKRMAVMNRGAIQQTGEPQEIYRQPQNIFVAGFVGWPPMNLLAGKLMRKGDEFVFEQNAGDASAGGFALKLPSAQPNAFDAALDKSVVLGIRPEDLGNAIDNREPAFDAVVSAIEPAGATTFFYFDIGNDTLVAAVPANESVRLQEKRKLGIDVKRIHLFDAATGDALRTQVMP